MPARTHAPAHARLHARWPIHQPARTLACTHARAPTRVHARQSAHAGHCGTCVTRCAANASPVQTRVHARTHARTPERTRAHTPACPLTSAARPRRHLPLRLCAHMHAHKSGRVPVPVIVEPASPFVPPTPAPVCVDMRIGMCVDTTPVVPPPTCRKRCATPCQSTQLRRSCAGACCAATSRRAAHHSGRTNTSVVVPLHAARLLLRVCMRAPLLLRCTPAALNCSRSNSDTVPALSPSPLLANAALHTDTRPQWLSQT